MPNMNALSTAELTQMQNDAVRGACDLTCVIERATRTPLPSGGASVVWNTVATVQAGMTDPTSTQLANYEYMIGSLAAWLIKLPVTTNVQEQDHLIINGETLEVVKVLRPRSYEVLLTVLASEVK